MAINQNIGFVPVGNQDLRVSQGSGNFMGAANYFSSAMFPNTLWLPTNMGYFIPGLVPSPTISTLSTPTFTAQEQQIGWRYDGNMGKFNSPTQAIKKEEPDQRPLQSVSQVKREEETVLKYEVNQQLGEMAGSTKQKKIRKRPSDKDYLPHRSQKKEVRKRLHQNQNRNVIPNQINQVISFLQKKTKSEHILRRLWEKYPCPEEIYSVHRFYLYQGVLKEKSGHYSNQSNLRLLSQLYEPECRIWSLPEQRHYIKLSRMLVGHFLREDSIPIILTSKRMRSGKKWEHLRARREVARRVLNLIKGQPSTTR